jgi:hypothetical protein
VIVRIESNPPEGGNLVIQSMEIVENGMASGSGVIGKSGGLLGCVLLLFIWQIAQPLTYARTKSFILGNQKSRASAIRVVAAPGWAVVVVS